MRCKVWMLWASLALAGGLLACEKLDDDSTPYLPARPVVLEDVARLFASLPIGPSQVLEVHDAAISSERNGYDEEYRLRELFAAPGSGVGDDVTRGVMTGAGATGAGAPGAGAPGAGAPGAGARAYSRPLRELLEEAVRGGATRSAAGGNTFTEEEADAFLAAL